MMRESLKKSAAHSPDKQFERYAKGSIVLCNACGLPIFRLDVAILLGDGLGRSTRAFKPLAAADVAALAARDDVDSGVRARLREMMPEQVEALCAKLHEVRAGDPAVCPVCGDCFVQVVAVERHEVLDKSYTVEMLVVPPIGRGAPVGGRRIGGGNWLN